MANRANRGIRDDVSYEVVFGESMTASYAMICSSRLCGIATHGAHGNAVCVKVSGLFGTAADKHTWREERCSPRHACA